MSHHYILVKFYIYGHALIFVDVYKEIQYELLIVIFCTRRVFDDKVFAIQDQPSNLFKPIIKVDFPLSVV